MWSDDIKLGVEVADETTDNLVGDDRSQLRVGNIKLRVVGSLTGDVGPTTCGVPATGGARGGDRGGQESVLGTLGTGEDG